MAYVTLFPIFYGRFLHLRRFLNTPHRDDLGLDDLGLGNRGGAALLDDHDLCLLFAPVAESDARVDGRDQSAHGGKETDRARARDARSQIAERIHDRRKGAVALFIA